MSTTEIEDLKYFVAGFFDGSPMRCRELDELLWLVRLSHKHEPQMLHCEAAPGHPAPESMDTWLELNPPKDEDL